MNELVVLIISLFLPFFSDDGVPKGIFNAMGWVLTILLGFSIIGNLAIILVLKFFELWVSLKQKCGSKKNKL